MEPAGVPRFDPTDTSTVSSRWKKWKRSFEIFLEVNNVTQPARKRSYLLHYAGPDVQDIFFNLRGENELEVPPDSDLYQESVQLLDGYFLPLKCLPRERHIFRNLEQSPDESIEKFVLRLREQGELCEYGNWLEENIKEQIFEKGISDELRAKILAKGNMTLAQTLDEGRSLETIAKHRKTLQRVEEINRISGQKGECFRCGESGHYANDQECPARYEKCKRCDLMGHYKKCCKTKDLRGKKHEKQRHRKSRVRQVVTEESSSDESDDQESDSGAASNVNYVFAMNPDPANMVKCKIGGVPLRWLIDSGAGANVISSEVWKFLKSQNVQLQYQTDQVTKKLYTYGGHKLSVKGMFIADIATKKSAVSDTVFVVEEIGVNLLGKNAAIKLGILKIDTTICTIGTNMEKIGKVKRVVVAVQIDPKIKAVQHTQSRIPIPLQPKVERELQKLLEQDIIEPAPSDSPWISRLVVRPKPGNNDEIRICVDMRDDNKAIVPQHHPLPIFDEIIPHLNDCKYFSKIDLNKAFHQVELGEESRPITTFASHNGYFRYKRLTFGMNCAAEVFQNIIERVLAGIPVVKVFIDDILVFGRSRSEHDSTLKIVFDRLREHGFTINERKCEIRKKGVMFMGHKLSGDGISPSEEKVDAIRRCRNPQSAEELRSFLGLINYLGKFIPNLSTLTAPLRELLHKDTRFKWESKHTDAFEAIKNQIADPKNLGYYSPYDETILIADASPVGLGAVLLQQREGKARVICYISKGLSTTEKSYAQNEKEALALVWATERLESYLRGLEFKLLTDHEPLKVMFGSNRKQCTRIERWAIRLQSFRFQIVHISGKANIADPLSRLPNFEKCKTYDQHGETTLLAILESATPNAITLNEIIDGTLKDDELAVVKESLNTGRWNERIKNYFPFRAELCIISDIVMRNDRIIIPAALRKRVLKLAYIGHPGIEKTKQRLRCKVWWPNVDKDAEKVVKSCLECQIVSNSVTPENMAIRELPQRPWQVIAMDMLGPLPSAESILVLIDMYSRYRWTEVLRTTTSEDIIERLDRTFMKIGLPSVLLSDNASNFSSHRMEQFCKRYGIQLKHTTPYWPQSNGEVERQNRSILKVLKIAELNKTDWKKDLEEANYVYSLVRHPATGLSSAELAFGRKFRDWIPELNTVPNEDGSIRDHDMTYKQNAKLRYDSKHRAKSSDLEPNDRVLMRNLIPKNKLSPMYLKEPVTVVSRKGNSVVVETDNGNKYRRNSAHLKKLIEEDVDGNESQDLSSEWMTPNVKSATTISSSTPIKQSGSRNAADGDVGRPKRETKRPLRFEDYDLNLSDIQ
ncbi:uncharacterized protein K02A2.6-like [Uranotaenia lowii]|uniref:uncharacterized protein K02A2.6-like n=1 Tax=Uranotaenia lowii TaxID=190385 RepID=UPI00247A1A8E|nr:uncharacterized protein K02A2.6-like [Uranotaenia lowii]